MMCYDHALHSEPLRAKAALLRARAARLCPRLDRRWWGLVRWHQRAEAKEWEPSYWPKEQPPHRRLLFWHSFVTEAQRRERPPVTLDDDSRHGLIEYMGCGKLGPMLEENGCATRAAAVGARVARLQPCTEACGAPLAHLMCIVRNRSLLLVSVRRLDLQR